MRNTTPGDAGWHLDEYDADRFWSRVHVNRGTPYASDPLATAEGDCWLWNSREASKTYGRFQLFGAWLPAHRVAFKDFGNPLPDDLDIDHLCRIHNCVNPAHLEAVTAEVNMRRGIPANRTHCPQGHEFTEANTNITLRAGRPIRRCRACRKAYAHKLYLRRKAA